MLCRLDRAALNLLHKRTARTKLTTGGELDIDFAVCGVLDVFLEVQLHDRIAARCAQHIGCGHGHDMIGGFFTVTFFVCSLGCGL